MKKIIKFIPFFLSILLILSACALGGTGKEAEKIAPVGQTEVTSEGINQTQKIVACNMLKSKDNQDKCNSQAQDMISRFLLSEIQNTFDVSRCKILPEELISDCENNINNTGVTGPVSDEDLAAYESAINPYSSQPEEETTQVQPTSPTYDKTKCAVLKAPGFKAYCEKQLDIRSDSDLLPSIIRERKIEKCDELKTEEVKRQCENMLGVQQNPTELTPSKTAGEEENQ
jgi:hypothetical protein